VRDYAHVDAPGPLFPFLETTMKMTCRLAIGAFVLTGIGLPGLGIAATTADDVAGGSAINASQQDTKPEVPEDSADNTAMPMQQHDTMAGMKPTPGDDPAGAATDTAQMPMHHHDMTAGTMHSTVDYTVPEVTLVRDDGKAVSLPDELNDGRPVILTFIYTTCTTICPMVSQTLEELQGKLGRDRDKVHLVSISIDPEEDTPARLRTYAARFDAGPQWQHYTGTVEASIAAQRAFNVYRGDKMNHTAVIFLRASPGRPWLRVDGMATPAELLAAWHDVVASN
jgi:protein SCO1/2